MKKCYLSLFVVVFAGVLILIIWCLRGTESSSLSQSAKMQESLPTTVQSVAVISGVVSEVVEHPDFTIKPVVILASNNVPTKVANNIPCNGLVSNGVDPAIIKRVEEERVPMVSIQSASLMVALKQYKKMFGSCPVGDSLAVSSALMGRNSSGTVFIDGDGWKNKKGELVDPWGMPYTYNFESNLVIVKSSGPNTIAGDTDDVVRAKSQ